jgi:hypothetical protein
MQFAAGMGRNSLIPPNSTNGESRLWDCRAQLENLCAVRDRHGLGSAAVFAMLACDDPEPATLRAAATVIAVVTRG